MFCGAKGIPRAKIQYLFKRYWSDLKRKLAQEAGSEQPYEEIVQLKLTATDGKQRETDCAKAATLLRVTQSIPSHNLRDHMTEAELIFTALAELSTRQIAETTDAAGMADNTSAAKAGGGIARQARRQLESQTGKSVVSGQNYLAPDAIKALKATKR